MLSNVIYPEDLSHVLIKDETGHQSQQIEPIHGLIPIYKHRGETPLECLNRLSTTYPVLKHSPLSYAGRLDPLAEGLMLVMVGDANKERAKYLSLDKAYEVDVLFGLSTDTGDILGLVKDKDLSFFLNTSLTDIDGEKIKNFEKLSEEKIKDFVGKMHLAYPAYSSKTVDGKPLFQYAKEGALDDIEIPTKEVEIYNMSVLNFRRISIDDLLITIREDIQKVNGDFRQEEIIKKWHDILAQFSCVSSSQNMCTPSLLCMTIKCECSSGAYMRVLAEEIGKKMGLPALAYTIKRTAVDTLSLDTLKGSIF